MSTQHFERKEPTLATQESDGQTNLYAPPRSNVDTSRGSGKLLPHQKAGRVIRLMAWLGVVGTVGIGAAIMIPAFATGNPFPFEVILVVAVAIALTAILFFVAGAVMRHETWGRYAGIAYGIISLPGIPIGTLVGLYILWQLIFGWAKYEAEASQETPSK